jgi:hypothetical protein
MSKETKVTAVDWLVEELNQKIDFIPMDKWDMIRNIVQQAKEMEKEQMEQAYWDGCINWDSEKEAEQYYKETYSTK